MPTDNVSMAGDCFLYPDSEFGIINTVSEQTVALQAAIALASSQGRILILPPYEVVVTTIVIPSGGVRIWGQSGGTGNPLSAIKGSINSPVLLLNAAFQSDVELKNFLVRGNKVIGGSQHGIQITGTNQNRIRIEDVITTECGGNGIHISAGIFSYVLNNVFSSDNAGHQFYIDANGSPCVTLLNCYAGTVAQNNYGFFIARGYVTMINCNGVNGGTSPISCMRVGDGALGSALVKAINCNFEDFTLYGIYGDTASDVILENCRFSGAGAGIVQPIYLTEPSGRSTIDGATIFIRGSNTYDNPADLPIKVYSRWISAEHGCNNPVSLTAVYNFYNQQDGRTEPLMNLSDRAATQTFAANYTEHGTMPGYYGCTNTGAARTLTLLDPQSEEVPEGRRVIVKDESGGAAANNITVNTVNARTIDGAASAVINTNYGRLTLVKRGTKYWRVD